MSRPDWRTMPRDAFDAHAPLGALFELTPGNAPAPADGCGTGDLLAELDEDS